MAVVAEVSISPLGTGSPGVSRYVAAVVRELESSGRGPQAAVLGLGTGRVYAVIKMDQRGDVEGRSAEDMVRSVREGS